jgi:uncharacterized metal-binding protein
MKASKCACGSSEILIFACSGGSNVGQVANEAAKNLSESGKGKMYCLAGVGGHISTIIETTKMAKRIVAIDGCPVHCAKKALEHAGFDVDVHVVVTKLGIKKSHNFTIKQDEAMKVEEAVGHGRIECVLK